jgi:hypothetical protein
MQHALSQRGDLLGLTQDSETLGHWLEFFVDESWLEHLRHHQRVTRGELKIEAPLLPQRCLTTAAATLQAFPVVPLSAIGSRAAGQEGQLNERPRKTLDYATRAECFSQSVASTN